MKFSSSILALLGCITLAASQISDIPLPLITNRSPAYSALNFQPNYNEQTYQQQPVQAVHGKSQQHGSQAIQQQQQQQNDQMLQQQQQQQFESSTGMKTSKISESESSSAGAYSSSSTGQGADREVISVQPISTSSGVSEYNVTIRPPQQQQRMPKLNVTIQPIVTSNGTAFNISIQLLSSTAGMASSGGAWDQPRECIVNGSSVHCEAASKSSSTGAGGPLAILDKVNASSLPAQKITIQPISTSTGMGQLIVLSSATGRLEKLISVVPVTSSSGFQEFNLTIQSPEALKSNASSTGAANNTSTSANNTNTSSTGMEKLPMMDQATGSPSTILLQPIDTSSGLGGLITISTSSGLNELVSILPVVASDGRREFNVTMQPASSTAALQSSAGSTGLASSSSGATKGVAATNSNKNRLRRIINRP